MHTKDPNLTKTPIDKSVDISSDAEMVEAKSNPYAEPSVEKGTVTLKDEYMDSEHVNKGDNPARQPDNRDQQGNSPFDDNVNENTVGNTSANSKKITDENRYASVDNAQTRVLNTDSK